jgi:hypothetical protein
MRRRHRLSDPNAAGRVVDNARALPTTLPAQHQQARQINILSSSQKEVRPREHSAEAIVGVLGAFLDEAIRFSC